MTSSRIDAWQRSNRWSGFAFGVVKKFGDDQAGNLAALVAYFAFFSLFPLLLVFVTVLGMVLVDHPDLQQRLVDSAVGQFPVIGDQIQENVGSLPGSGLVLLIGILGSLWAGTGAVMGMQNAMDGVWNVPRRSRPKLVGARLRSVGMLIVLGGAIIALTVVGSAVRSLSPIGWLDELASFGVSVLLGVGVFLVAFKLLTSVTVDWRDLLPGAALAALAWSVLQIVGGAFVRHVVQGSSSTSGVFAVVLGLLSWLYLQAQLTVLAAELNVVRRERLWPRSMTAKGLTDGDRRALLRYAAVELRVDGQEVTVDLGPPAVPHAIRARSDGTDSGADRPVTVADEAEVTAPRGAP